jgi:hypothetical protein
MKIQIRKRRVTIIGLLGAQASAIRNEYGHQFDLKIFDSKRPRAAKYKGDVVLMTRFIDHVISTAWKTDRVHYCNGTLTSLRALLNNLPPELPTP